MTQKANIEVDAELAAEALVVLKRSGLNLESATAVFLRRCVTEQGLPFHENGSAPGSSQKRNQVEARSSGIKITQDMVESVWEAFKDYNTNGGDLRRIADDISSETGMNAGSALIYLVILNNLVNGRQNRKNMKMRDLEFYMARIKDTYGNTTYRNALTSLEMSIPYWDSQFTGDFANKLQMFRNS